MSLEVSGGGSLAVTTEALLEHERMLASTAARAHTACTSAGAAVALAGSVAAPASWALRLAEHELAEVAHEARRLCAELRLASEVYGLVERALATKQQWLAAVEGPLITVPLALVALAAAFARRSLGAPDDAAVVAALRDVADSVDLAAILALVQAVPGPALEETPVSAVRADEASVPRTAEAPGGFAALAARIPPAVDGEPQVRVERYVLPSGEVRWVVYIAGTSDWSIEPRGDPWDDTSNVVGLAGQSAGSTRATVAALMQAGWQPGEAVLPVGHSQGGIVATALTASGIAPVPMLVTFGSPTAGVAVAPGVVDVAIEHRDDLVPALGGSPPLGDARLLVRAPAPETTAGGVLAAHSIDAYQQTAGRLDASSDERAGAARATLADFTRGQEAEVTMWRGEREPRATARE